MTAPRLAASLVVLLAFSCKDEAPDPTSERDAGAIATALESNELGVRVPLLPSWRVTESTVPTGDGAQTITAARRIPSDKPFLAAPRLVMTVEPTVMQDAEPVFRDTLAELKSIGMRENVTVIRTSLSTRPIPGATLGDIEMVYRLMAGDKGGKTIIHRSIVVLRTRADESRAIVTVTSTYLAENRELVGAEVQVMLDGVELFDPPRKQ